VLVLGRRLACLGTGQRGPEVKQVDVEILTFSHCPPLRRIVAPPNGAAATLGWRYPSCALALGCFECAPALFESHFGVLLRESGLGHMKSK